MVALTMLERAFESMTYIREFEEHSLRMVMRGKIRGAVHLGVGQEACAVGARFGLEDDDVVLATYRGHPYALAWGMPLSLAAAELFGRRDGSNGGLAGSKHIGSLDHGVAPGNAIVAGHVPTACGMALASKVKERDRVVLCVLGDGAMNQGVVYECLNLAAIWSLPIIFWCENNQYAEMTPIADVIASESLAQRAEAFGVPVMMSDGMDVGDVINASERSRAIARTEGPVFVELETYRFSGHMSGDPEGYRNESEIEEWRTRDPIRQARLQLENSGQDPAELDAIGTRATERVIEAFDRAEEGAPPSWTDVESLVRTSLVGEEPPRRLGIGRTGSG